jgi:hypothetical protein
LYKLNVQLSGRLGKAIAVKRRPCDEGVALVYRRNEGGDVYGGGAEGNAVFVPQVSVLYTLTGCATLDSQRELD